jgi:DNA modification methylase
MSRKHSEKQTLNMFELQSNSESAGVEKSQAISSLPQSSSAIEKIDPLRCPKCSSRSQPTAHPVEHAGATRYCIVCVEADGEPYYFTPEADAPSDSDELIEVSASKYDQEKLFNTPVAEAKGKTIESLEYSREKITEVMRRFNGDLPQSIMKADKKSRPGADLAAGSYTANEKYTGAFAKSSSGARYGALSAFPQNIGRAVVELYSEKGQTVVDPFAGHNSRMELVIRSGRNYIGCDVSAKFMQFNREQREKLLQEFPEAQIELHEIDSRKMSDCVEQWVGDFTLTSPPYYNIEDYGDEHAQLGKAESYAEFLRSLRKVAEQNFRALKSGAYCCWFVNDFRDDGVFNPYHIDTFNMLIAVGFVAHDMMIVDFGVSFGQCFPAQVVERRILPKRHEYCIVMRKL